MFGRTEMVGTARQVSPLVRAIPIIGFYSVSITTPNAVAKHSAAATLPQKGGASMYGAKFEGYSGLVSGRRGIAVLFALVAAGAACVVLLSGHTRAGAQATYSSYPALGGTGPTGLTIAASEQQAKEATGPVWMAQAAGEANSVGPEQVQHGRPEVSSIRKVDTGVPGALVWIAKSTSGGICVLASTGKPLPNGRVATAASCSTAAGGLSNGAAIELSGLLAGSSTEVLLAGVVPSGVSSLSAVLADGSTTTATVADNGWAVVTQSRPVAVAYSVGGTVHQVKVGG